jgi:hypothetical protein
MTKYIDRHDVHYRIAGKNAAEATVVCVQDFDYYDYTFLNEELFATEEEAEGWLTVHKIQNMASGKSLVGQIMDLLEIVDRKNKRIEELED